MADAELGAPGDLSVGQHRMLVCCFFFFFKQKTAYEIGTVTGVQTCALPIFTSGVDSTENRVPFRRRPWAKSSRGTTTSGDGRCRASRPLATRRRPPIRRQPGDRPVLGRRSEERRVGKECRARWSPYP